MTSRCRDADDLPRVPGAGETVNVDGVAVQVMHNGLRVIAGAYQGEWQAEVIRQMRGTFEPQEEKVFAAVLRHLGPGAGRCMVELGSWWSYYSLWFQREFAGARSVLVEPCGANIETGWRNFALNGATGEFVRASIGESSSEGPVPFACKEDGCAANVPRLSIDDLLEQRGLRTVDILHADIQGAELEMLHGAMSSIEAGRIRFLFLSTHHHAISGDPLTHQRCLEFVRTHGGHVIAEHTVAESFSGDGLIVCSFWPADREMAVVPVSRNVPSASYFRETEYDLAELATAYDALAASHERLAADHAEAVAARARSFADYQTLAASYQALSAAHASLGATHGSLLGAHETLTGTHDNLNREYEVLVGSNAALSADCASLAAALAESEKRRGDAYGALAWFARNRTVAGLRRRLAARLRRIGV